MEMIRQTPAGGRWTDPGTWEGGVVPDGETSATTVASVTVMPRPDGMISLEPDENWWVDPLLEEMP